MRNIRLNLRLDTSRILKAYSIVKKVVFWNGLLKVTIKALGILNANKKAETGPTLGPPQVIGKDSNETTEG